MCIKQLLGVRTSTCNDMCYIELGYPLLKVLVRSKQRNFFTKLWQERSRMADDPLAFTINTVPNARYNTRTFLSQLLSENKDDASVSMETFKHDCVYVRFCTQNYL